MSALHDAAALARRTSARGQASLAAWAAILGPAQVAAQAAQALPPTFNQDVAPIVYRSCSVCHRPGEAGPFPLLGYEDVASRARQIALVTQSRFMPPWLPAPGCGEFEGNRSLSAEEIDTLRRWVESGSPEGAPADRCLPPQRASGWQLGEPDLVASMPEPFALPAEGRDVYRSFVLPAPVRETRYVRAVEFRPDDRTVVHHAALFVDRSGAARALDAEDPEPGYPGMGPGPARIPDNIFVGWAPGKVPHPGREGFAWRLDERTDLVLQLHLRPTGKPERVGVTLGFHFAAGPPALHPLAIHLRSLDIDIPPGERAYLVEDRYELPVDVDVLSVAPHAHYLGRDLQAFAVLPDGTTRWLVHIPAWDFNWQDQYHYAEPVHLAKGSVIAMRYTYDNSADNPLNPSQPPRRVAFGEQSSDEMGELMLQVLPREEDAPILWRDFQRKVLRGDTAYLERKAREEPENPRWHALLAANALRVGRTAEAVERYRRVVELRAGQANPLCNLGRAYVLNGEPQPAVSCLESALALEPGHLPARVELARAHQALGRTARARAELERVLSLDPLDADAHTLLGEILAQEGRRDAAARHFQRAIEARPDEAKGLWSLGRIRFEQGRHEEALALYRRALELQPDDGWAHHLLGLALESRGELEEALRHLALARELAPWMPAFEREFQRASSARAALQDGGG